MNEHKFKEFLITAFQVPCVSLSTDLSNLFRGDFVRIWTYLYENIKTSEDAKLIRQNLALAKRVSCLSAASEQEDSYGYVSEVRKEYANLIKRFHGQQKQLIEQEALVQSLKQKLLSSSQAADVLRAKISETRLKNHFLVAHHAALESEINKIKSFHGSIQVISDQVNRSEIAAKGSQLTKDGSNANLTDIRSLHTQVSDIIRGLLSEDLTKTQLLKEKSKVKQRLKAVVTSTDSSDIISFVAHGIRAGADNIINDKSLTDEAKDSGMFMDSALSYSSVEKSTEPPAASTVAQLVEDLHVEHQQRYLATESCKAKVKLLNRESEKLKLDIRNKLSSLPNELNMKAKLIHELIEKQVEERSMNAALMSVQSAIQTLEDKVSVSKANVENLQRKHRMIKNFQADVIKQQDQIRVLLKQNSSAASKFEERRVMVGNAIKNLVSCDEVLKGLSCTSLTDNLSTEMRQFQTIPLYSLTDKPCSVLRPLHQVQGKSKADVKAIAETLGWQPYKSCDEWIQNVVWKKKEVVFSYTRCPVLLDLNYCNKVFDDVSSLLASAEKTEQTVISRITPVLTNSMQTVKASLEKCDSVYVAIDSWWHQPALKLDLKAVELKTQPAF